jgi:hypothetical protein
LLFSARYNSHLLNLNVRHLGERKMLKLSSNSDQLIKVAPLVVNMNNQTQKPEKLEKFEEFEYWELKIVSTEQNFFYRVGICPQEFCSSANLAVMLQGLNPTDTKGQKMSYHHQFGAPYWVSLMQHNEHVQIHQQEEEEQNVLDKRIRYLWELHRPTINRAIAEAILTNQNNTIGLVEGEQAFPPDYSYIVERVAAIPFHYKDSPYPNVFQVRLKV